MRPHYYYFVAGLPDLFLDEKRSAPSFVDFIAEAEIAVEEADRPLLAAIRLPFDNTNVINTLEGRPELFDGRGNFTKEQVAAAIKGAGDLPDYLRIFIQAYREGRPLFGGYYSWPDRLNGLFYDDMTGHPNEFLREWFTFERDLRNVLTAMNLRTGWEHLSARAPGGAVPAAVIGDNAVAEMLRRSNAPDFGLSGKVPWVDRIFELSKKHLLDFEKGIDELRWSMVDDLLPIDYFRVETVLGCAIKLLLVERWMRLTEQEGRAAFHRIVRELAGQFIMKE